MDGEIVSSLDPVTPPAQAPSTDAAPAEDTNPATAAPATEDANPAPDAQATATLYSLPDGRQVDAETLQREWKENFMPDYTQKSQKLAAIERGGQQTQQPLNNPNVPKWQDPNYTPSSWGELVELGKQAALEELQSQARAEEEQRSRVVSEVDQQITALKGRDPKLDENALFQHANKYGFRDLNAAYENMADMRKVVTTVEQRTLQNVKSRSADPVAGGGNPAATGAPGTQQYGEHGQYGSALEYLRSKGS